MHNNRDIETPLMTMAYRGRHLHSAPLADADPMTSKLLDRLSAAGNMPNGSPCGPDLEYSSAFLEFMTQARGRAEQQLGDSILPAQEPDWNQVLDRGAQLLHETRDLRVLVTVTLAATELDGLPGLTIGLRLVRGWLEEHWEALHPLLVYDGERDPLPRMNALASLADPKGMMRAVRAAPLLESQAGTVTVGEADLVLRGRPVPASATVSTADHLSRLVSAERERNAVRIALLAEARKSLATIEATWRGRVEADYWPELAPLAEVLARVEAAVAPPGEADGVPQADAAEPPAAAGTPAPAARPPAAALPPRVDSRADAFRALAIARAYFEAHEPSHPAPLLIRRIERLSDLDFAQILAELVPEGLAQLEHLAGSRA